MAVEAENLNLLPPPLRYDRVLRKRRLRLAVLTASLLLLFSGYLVFLARLTATENRLSQVRETWSRLNPERREAEEIVNRKKEAEVIRREYQTRIREQKRVTPLLKDCGELIPVDICLSQLEIAERPADKKGRRKGRFFHLEGYAGQTASAGVLVCRLQQLPYLDQVALLELSGDQLGLKFTIEGAVKEMKR